MNGQESDCFHFVSHEKHQTRSPHPSHLTFFNNEIYETEDDWCTDKTGAASFSFQGFGFLKSPLKKRTMTDKLPSSFFFFVNHHPHRIRPRPRPTSPPRSSRPGLALAPRTWRTGRRRDSSREEIFVCKRGDMNVTTDHSSYSDNFWNSKEWTCKQYAYHDTVTEWVITHLKLLSHHI